jgi:hypothetical protein
MQRLFYITVTLMMVLVVACPGEMTFASDAPRNSTPPPDITESTFEVHLQGFTDNPDTDNIGTIRMVLGWPGTNTFQLYSEGIAGACSGWYESTGSGSINGPSVFMSAHDPHAAQYRNYVDYPLQDGILFWIDCTATVTEVTQIYFWNAPDIGDWDVNEYPSVVQLTELTSTRAVFSAGLTPNDNSTWGKVKALYR